MSRAQRISISLLAICLLLSTTAAPVFASGNQAPLGGISPDVSRPLPGGGTGWAEARLQWGLVYMQAIASTRITGTKKGYYLCAQVYRVYLNNYYVGSTANKCNGMPGVFQQVAVYTWWGNPKGKTWKAVTSHIITDFGSFNWQPTLTVNAKP
jgi:hypothetical protein